MRDGKKVDKRARSSEATGGRLLGGDREAGGGGADGRSEADPAKPPLLPLPWSTSGGPTVLALGEMEGRARAGLDRVRALFSDGVVWLRVGKGAANRLPFLMLRLAKRRHKNVMEEGVDAPAVGEDGESCGKKMVSQESRRYLVVLLL